MSEFYNWGNSPKEDAAMLHIVGNMKTLKGELISAKNIFKGVIGVLENVDSKTNLTKELGIFAVQMPEYKIFTKDAEYAKKTIRKVCSGELSVLNALQKFRCALTEVEELLKMLDNYP